MQQQKSSLFKLMQKVPGGLIIVPMLIGTTLNTVAPDFLKIGGFTTGLFSSGTSCLLGLFLLLNGASIDLKKIGMPLYKGAMLTLIKFILGVTLGAIVVLSFGAEGILGITPIAIIAALTNSGGGLYLGLANQYGDETDVGAISILSLNDGPFFTMLAVTAMAFVGIEGLEPISLSAFMATLIPLIVGIVWGNLDAEFRRVATNALPIVTFFMMVPIGAGMNFKSLIDGGVPGLLLALISALTAFVFFVLYQFVLPKNKRNAMGAAIGNTAANAAAVPVVLMASNPEMAATASAQCAVAALITAFTCPLITDMCDKYMRKNEKGIYSKEAIAEREALKNASA